MLFAFFFPRLEQHPKRRTSNIVWAYSFVYSALAVIKYIEWSLKALRLFPRQLVKSNGCDLAYKQQMRLKYMPMFIKLPTFLDQQYWQNKAKDRYMLEQLDAVLGWKWPNESVQVQYICPQMHWQSNRWDLGLSFCSLCVFSPFQFDFATSAASISCEDVLFLTRLHLLMSNLRNFLFLLFLLYPDRMTNLMEKQNASSCQTLNKAASPVCACAEERGRGNVMLRKEWMKNDDDHSG